MSVLIKGMEMPKSCEDCKVRMPVGCYGNLPHNIRHPNCPLVEVPMTVRSCRWFDTCPMAEIGEEEDE